MSCDFGLDRVEIMNQIFEFIYDYVFNLTPVDNKVTSNKFLGLYHDTPLTWKDHVSKNYETLVYCLE